MSKSPATRIWPLALLVLASAVVVGVWWRGRGEAASTLAPGTPAGAAKEPTPPRTSEPAPRASAAAEPRSALDQALAGRDPRVRAREFGRELERWMERDFEAALAYVRQMPAGTERSQAVLQVLELLGRRDMDRALVVARELVANREERAIYGVFFDQLASQGVTGAIERLGAVPAGAARDIALRALMDVWSRRDLPTALAWAQRLSDPNERSPALEAVLHELAAKDPLQAIEVAQKSLEGPALQRALLASFQTLATSDPQGAASLVSLLPAGETQTLVTGDTARALAARNIQDALNWARLLPTDTTRWVALNNIFTVWAQQDIAAAARYVSALPPGREQHDAAVSLASHFGAGDPQGSIRWAQSLPAGETRGIVLVNITNAWAQKDPAGATQWVAAQPPETLSSLAPKALNATLSYWVLQDAGAAREFVRRLPAEQQAGAAVFAAPLLAQLDPAATLAWADALPDPKSREGALAAAFARWRGNAPDAARAWLEGANLAPEVKTRLRQSR